METVRIRKAAWADLADIAYVEAECFPRAEAADEERLAQRLRVFGAHFWVLETEGGIAGFINGMVTDERTIRDEMFADASLHREDGAYQSVFGLAVLPGRRKRGYGARLMNALTEASGREGRKGCILTCKEGLIPYYEKFGYRCLGRSRSEHGGAVWYDMLLSFKSEEPKNI